jgi:hypothetical protein
MTMRRSEAREPIHKHTRDWYDEYYARLNVLRARHPHLDARELHYRSLPPVANAEPAKPTAAPEPPPRTHAEILWPYMNRS